MEFPVLFFHNKVEPFIFGFLIYGYILILYVYCIVMFYAYKVNWGERDSEGVKEMTGSSIAAL